MLLWNSLKIKDIMRAAVMVIVSLVVMQIMIIGEEIVSLASSPEFWKSMSWSMGLILVPLINSSKQKYIIKSYHDLQHGEISDSGVSEVTISYNPFILDGWVTKYNVKMIQSSTLNQDVYLMVMPRFNNKAYDTSSDNPGNQYSDILRIGMNGGPETIHEYTNFRPYVTYFRNGGPDGMVKSASVDLMEWADKGTYMHHVLVSGADGTLSAGGIDIYIEYTFVVANYNDTSRSNPKKSNTFLTIAWNATLTDQRSIIMNTGLRLISTEVFVTNMYNNETLIIGKNVTGAGELASSTESVNDWNVTPTDNELIFMQGTAMDSSSSIDYSETQSMNYFHKHPMYFHKGESLNLLAYNLTGGINLWMTSQVLFNYQDQNTIEVEDTMLNTANTNYTKYIRMPTDIYIESIELELLCEESGLNVREGQFDIYGIKDNDFQYDNNSGTHFSIAGFQGRRFSNILDKMKFTTNGDQKASIYQSYCSPMDYYPQGSTIFCNIQTESFDKVEFTILIKGRNARKSNNRDALQFWRNDITSLKVGGGQ